MMSWAESYLDRLDEMSQLEARHFRVSPPDVRPPISSVMYVDDIEPYPQYGFTIGLSSYEHCDWKIAKPELCISINSIDPKWTLAVGELAYRLKGDCPFCYGDLIRFGCPISSESELSAFVAFAPSFMPREDTSIELFDRTISLIQMYPIYEDEIAWIDKFGMEEFFTRPGSFFEDPKRKSLSS